MRAKETKSTAAVSPASRRAVNLSLDGHLVPRARALTGNSSATIEKLLTAHVLAEEERQRLRDEKLDQVISALNEAYEKHGLLSDEFSTW